MILSDSIWQDCPDTVRSTDSYLVFSQVVAIDIFTHVTGSVAKSSANSEYNAAYNVGMDLANSVMLNN